MKFEFATATRIIFGAGALGDAGLLAAELGQHALVVTGGTSQRAAPLLDLLRMHGVAATTFGIATEPTTDMVIEGTRRAREAGCDLVVAIGGGSVLDAGKTIAVTLTNPGDLLDYLEVVGRGQPFVHPAAPFLAIPTTAGTGSEVTRNAVLGVPAARVKVSLRSPLMLPRVALVDPQLTYDMPPGLTASTGMDALTQCVEPFVSAHSNPLTDALCREGLQRVARSFGRAFHDGADAGARTDMALASLCGGLALANARLGAVHGIAGPLGGMFPAPHGTICARLLPLVMEANIRVLRTRAPAAPALARYDEIASTLTGDASADADAGVAWVRALCAEFAIPSLGSHGVAEQAIPEVVAKAQRASSMRGNPIDLTDAELATVLRQAILTSA